MLQDCGVYPFHKIVMNLMFSKIRHYQISIYLVCSTYTMYFYIPSPYCGSVGTESGVAAICSYWVEGVALVSTTLTDIEEKYKENAKC